MKIKDNSDEQLLDMIAHLCHFIAFETTAKTAPSSDTTGNTELDKNFEI